MEHIRDFWQYLGQEPRDIWLYGMGNGADKLLSEAEARRIKISGVFASDGFVRGHSFHDMRVISFSELSARYPVGECVILLAFGSARPEVLELTRRVAQRYPLFVPDLPVCGNNLFDAAFFEAHRAELDAAEALFSDEPSRRLFRSIVQGKVRAEYSLLIEAVSHATPFDYLAALPRPIRRMADLGAYNGDSAKEALARFPLSFLLAAEPDARNFKKLSAFCDTLPEGLAECHRVAMLDRVGEVRFDASGNRNAGVATGRESVAVPCATLDSLLRGRAVDYIKYDVEGAEHAALLGSADTIRAHRPAIRLSLYHRPEDLFELPLLLRALAPNYDFYLTRALSLPLWDIDLVGIPREK